MFIVAKCPICGEVKKFLLPDAKVAEWREGRHIQEVFPELSADDRERLISGICPTCWKKVT